MRQTPVLLLAALLAGCASAPASTQARGPDAASTSLSSAARRPDATPSELIVNEEGDDTLVASKELDDALDLYGRGELAQAAARFYAASATPSGRSAEAARKAQFFLAKALDRLGYRVAPLAILEGVSRDPRHEYRLRALPWLARAADALPDDEPVIRCLERYAPEDIERAASSQPAPVLHLLRYLLGRVSYRRGDTEEAIARLGRVPLSSRWYVHASFFRAVGFVRKGDRAAAVRSFRAILSLTEGQGSEGGRGSAAVVGAPIPEEERARLRDLARISLARAFYSGADPAEGSFDGASEDVPTGDAALRAAAWLYEQIPAGSESYEDAKLEQAHAYAQRRDFARAEESLDRLSRPFIERTPEARVLRAIVELSSCRTDAASGTIATFLRDYDRQAAEVERLGREGDASLIERADRARAGTAGAAGADATLAAVVTGALAQRDARRLFELLALTKAEKALIAGASPGVNAGGASLRETPLGARILADLERTEADAGGRISAIVRSRCDRFVLETREQVGRAKKLAESSRAAGDGRGECASRTP